MSINWITYVMSTLANVRYGLTSNDPQLRVGVNESGNKLVVLHVISV